MIKNAGSFYVQSYQEENSHPKNNKVTMTIPLMHKVKSLPTFSQLFKNQHRPVITCNRFSYIENNFSSTSAWAVAWWLQNMVSGWFVDRVLASE